MADPHHDADPLDPNVLLGHVKDSLEFHFPRWLGGHVKIPQLFEPNTSFDKAGFVEPLDGALTKFMVIEVMVAAVVVLLFAGLASKIRGGNPPKGRLWNMLEAMLLFIRDQVARPAIGHHADQFLPFLWTLFFFVLGCNLFGMIPWLGSPTGSLAVTGVLAFATFFVVVKAGVKELGAVGFLKAQVPHMDLPPIMAIFIKPMVFAIELLGMFIKHGVLSIRLLANMAAGHLVLAVLLAFIAVIAKAGLTNSLGGYLTFYGVSFASVCAALAISLLELFVAFLQAYIFTFLSALFIGSAVHPH